MKIHHILLMVPPFKRKQALIFVTTFATLAAIVSLRNFDQVSNYLRATLNAFLNATVDPRNGTGVVCELPKLDPFDRRIAKFIRRKNSLSCRNVQEDAVHFVTEEKNASISLRLNDAVVTKFPNLTCQLRCVSKSGDDKTKFGDWANAMNVTIDCDFNEVRCNSDEDQNIIYDYIHASVIPNRTLEAVWKNLSIPPPAETTPSVLILIIDSTSRSNLIRQLPDTYKFVVSELGAIDFDSYNKAGYNSFPNALPILAGLSSAQMQDESKNWQTYCDDWPLIWKHFSKKQYATLWAEDMPYNGLFQYQVKGFRRQPTTHYMTPFWTVVEASKLLNKKSTYFCYGNRLRHKVHLDYCSDFLRNYDRRVPKFGVCWTSFFAHDSINTAGMADGDFLEFFKRNRDFVENSFVFFLSDHGSLMDKIRESAIGKLEASLPFLLLMTPKWFGHSFKNAFANVVLNARERRLVSTFDLHTTLVNIAEGNFNADNQTAEIYGRSLFSEIPADRTCLDAGIETTFCACTKQREVASDSPEIRLIANAVIIHLNSLLKEAGYASVCATLSLATIDYATQLDSSYYVVRLKAAPSNGVFEALTRLDSNGGDVYVRGDVLRVNRYGNESSCIQHKTLRMYCFCTK